MVNLEIIHELKNSVANADTVKGLYYWLASTLGFDSTMSRNFFVCNTTLCTVSCGGPNGSSCSNESCSPCSTLYTEFGAVFASFSYLLLLISSIQLIVVMVHDSLQDDKHVQSRLKKAFRTTVQKCLLGAVMLATGSRAIYYTIQNFIPDKWGDILLNVYYPSLLSAFSLLICFWAELLYSPSQLKGQTFLTKYKSSVMYLAFNIIVYLLLLANIIATPLISDQEQIYMSGIVGIIFAAFLFLTLIGFLHFAIRLFFRPDWQPLFVRLNVLRINLRQQLASMLGVISNALMQSLIIALLVFNMVVRYIHVDGYNLYVCAIVIRVTELIMPLWFCCSLWNCKEPMRLWLLNPGLILKQVSDDVESKPLMKDRCHSATTNYGTASLCSSEGTIEESSPMDEDKEGGESCCWVCLEEDNVQDLFYPCNCKLHRKCIKQWIAKRASTVNVPEKEYMRCQVCRKKYIVKTSGFFFCHGMQRSHWLMLLGAGVLVLLSIIGLALFGVYSSMESRKKIFIICCVAVVEAILAKVVGIKVAMIFRKAKYRTVDLDGLTLNEMAKKRNNRSKKLISLHKHAPHHAPPLPIATRSVMYTRNRSEEDRISIVELESGQTGEILVNNGRTVGSSHSAPRSVVSVEVSPIEVQSI